MLQLNAAMQYERFDEAVQHAASILQQPLKQYEDPEVLMMLERILHVYEQLNYMDEAIAVLEHMHRYRDKLNSRNVQQQSILCQYTLEQAQLLEQLKIDALTGVYNRASCRALLSEAADTIPIPKSNVTAEQTIQRVTRKIQLYELRLITLAFFFAMSTTLFNEQAFQFIMSYFVLGVAAYLFYRSWLFTVLLAFIPTALASVYDTIRSYDNVTIWWEQSVSLSGSAFQAMIQHVAAALFTGVLHTMLTLLGAVVVYLVQKAFQREEGR